MSCELQALTKMIQDTLRGSATTNQSANKGPLFQGGKSYDEYSARRNERLIRKRGGESGVEKKTQCKQYLGVRMESAKRTTGEVKQFESARKMMTPRRHRGSKSLPGSPRLQLTKQTRKLKLCMNLSATDNSIFQSHLPSKT
ncbi:hypothetical protein L1987_65345 [Smallanthus sonchifolius]|uniref:Uncharacterized protein n=1 Tax=Smallanthus sonchifolius TaxID=185202 RepID=A0ACB9BU67_9ASTR|nr:hypothetical protein L1987_65345 [Smallanthus sonchifolius]